jgi:hypothetical protein
MSERHYTPTLAEFTIRDRTPTAVTLAQLATTSTPDQTPPRETTSDQLSIDTVPDYTPALTEITIRDRTPTSVTIAQLAATSTPDQTPPREIISDQLSIDTVPDCTLALAEIAIRDQIPTENTSSDQLRIASIDIDPQSDGAYEEDQVPIFIRPNETHRTPALIEVIIPDTTPPTDVRSNHLQAHSKLVNGVPDIAYRQSRGNHQITEDILSRCSTPTPSGDIVLGQYYQTPNKHTTMLFSRDTTLQESDASSQACNTTISADSSDQRSESSENSDWSSRSLLADHRRSRTPILEARSSGSLNISNGAVQKHRISDTVLSYSRKKIRFQDAKDFAQIASRFGDLDYMTYILYHGLLSRRQYKNNLPKDFATRWKAAKVDQTPFSLLRSRFLRAELIKEWLQIVAGGGQASGEHKKTERELMSPKMEVDLRDEKGWESCRKWKSRYSIWYKICKIFEPELGSEASVALCALVDNSCK